MKNPLEQLVHDLNNPLLVLMGRVELLKEIAQKNPEKLKDPEWVLNYLNKIEVPTLQIAETVKRHHLPKTK